jgi:hypothetical protein
MLRCIDAAKYLPDSRFYVNFQMLLLTDTVTL